MCIRDRLGALDLKLRKGMQIELKRMQQHLGITFVFVTHDQEEALTMSDRVAVMRAGQILQLGTPEDIYNEPQSAYVADFIGDSNIFREGCTIHTGTKPGSETRIGSRNMFMNATHVAHNCIVGNDVIYVGYAGTAGYCEIFDNVLISGLVGIHQFCRVGRFAIISGGSVFSKDIPPFMMAEGRNGGVKMINKVGLQRAGFSTETISVIKQIFRIYYRSGLIPTNALERIRTELPQIPEVREFIHFCETSKKGVISAQVEGHRS